MALFHLSPTSNKSLNARLDNLTVYGLIVCVAVVLTTGCNEKMFGDARDLPAPVRTDFPYELEGRQYGIFGGDHFQVYHHGAIHYIVVQGVDTPERDMPKFNEARRALIRLLNHKPLRVRVVGHDEHKREIAFVYVEGRRLTDTDVADPITIAESSVDVGLEMIRLGWGKFDGNEFDGFETYVDAEALARESKIGIWADVGAEKPVSDPKPVE